MSHLALVGFMGTGKTTIGRLVAERLGVPFVDADDLIAARAGLPIPDIFARQGEDRFRHLEAQVIADLLRGPAGLVLATGGGAVGDDHTLRLLATHAFTVCLTASPQRILERTRDTARPMLAGHSDRLARVRELLEQRRSRYQLADACLDTTDLDPEQGAAAVLRLWGTVSVPLGDRSYPIHLGRDLLADPALYPPASGCRIVTNPAVGRLYSSQVVRALAGQGCPVGVDVVAAGERAKHLRQAERLWRSWLQAGLDREGLVIALGGGVVGDLAGFAASAYLRGVRVVQVPTTLLAQVDASVGGKTAIDLAGLKNIVGAFHQPSAVLADMHTLRTLPPRELRSGMAEVVKHGLLGDAPLFEYLEARLEQALARHPLVLAHLVRRSCVLKAGVVAADERESGLRAALNLGHTFGHALESEAGLGRLHHGEAVALGLVAACHVSARLGLLSPADALRVTALLRRARLPVTGSGVAPARALAAMRQDKKTRAGKLRFVLPTAIGSVQVGMSVPDQLVLAALAQVAGEGIHP